MMKIGVRAHDFGRQTEAMLPMTVKAAGFEAVQLALTKAIDGIHAHSDVVPSRLDGIRQCFSDCGVEISVLGCYVEPSLPGERERLRQVDDFLLGLEHAKILGAPIVGTETTRLDPTPENEKRRESLYLNLRDSVFRMAEKAEKVDVEIGIEPVADHTLNTPELARRLLDEVGSGKVKIILDPVNMILADTVAHQDDIFRNFFSLLGGDIRIVHVKDIVFENDQKIWRNIGQGIVHNDIVFEWLRVNKPAIPVLREHAKADSCAVDVAALRILAGRDA